MKKKLLFVPLISALVFTGCSSDVTETILDETPEVFTSDEAYINVRLMDAGAQTRATAGNPEYEYGSINEHAVQNAFFYFYDANGVFVAEGSAWNGGKEGEEDPNIEFKSNAVVVLKGLTKKNYPKYMVTVLNRPTGFTVPSSSTLDDMRIKLASESEGIRENDKFVMSTTSFKQDELTGKYFVTEVNGDNFLTEPINPANEENQKNFVTVYVERLAAKVSLKVSEELATTEINGETYYKIKATVAGENNDADIENNDNQIAAENLYVKILGWKLNATAKKSYIVKNINENWDNTENGSLGFEWNRLDDHRSFWGQSFNYGLTSYVYPTTAVNYNSGDTNCPLNYFNLNEVLPVGGNAYCAENTNTSGIVTNNFPSAVTSVLLKAMVCDEKGNALNLVRFNGLLFKKESFTEYILNVMKAKNNWNVWVETTAEGSTDKKYALIGTEYVDLANAGDGKVKIQLATGGVTLYTRTGSNGNYTYTPITDLSDINNKLIEETNGAIGYNGGLMYYNIPIEHLNNTAVGQDGTIPEAKYGVVRNHHYVVTINKLENMGKGIFDPDEIIVPGKDDDKESYYVNANINILSWKIVNQSVEL